MGTGGLSSRSFAIQNWSRSNRRSHRRTRWASGASCLQSKASTTLSLACAPTAPNSSARWPSTRTCTDSATCEALRASSSRWPRNSSEAFTAFGETGGALGAPSTRSHGSQPSCFLAYLRRGFVRRTKGCRGLPAGGCPLGGGGVPQLTLPLQQRLLQIQLALHRAQHLIIYDTPVAQPYKLLPLGGQQFAPHSLIGI